MNGEERVELDGERVGGALRSAFALRSPPVRAITFIRRWESNARPVAFRCDDGLTRVVKRVRRDTNLGRALVNDHIVAHLGYVLGAPVGEPWFVDVPAELVAAEPQIQHFTPGIGHGTLFIDRCTDREGVGHVDVPANRARFALLALLYGWALANDHQLIYTTEPPYLVYSVDHGHFLPGSANWVVADLNAAPRAIPDPVLVQGCGLTPTELRQASWALLQTPIRGIIDAVASPLDEWGITEADRLALVRFLVRRRAQLLTGLLA